MLSISNSMADYQTALNTSLGDYISHRASQEGIPEGVLEKRLTIEPIRVQGMALIGNPSYDAVKDFNRVAANYDAVVELREGLSDIRWLGFLGSCYRISGTGIKQK